MQLIEFKNIKTQLFFMIGSIIYIKEKANHLLTSGQTTEISS
jgi:hypothetical protein